MPESRRFEAMGALITGGASGIGLATARRILAEGGQVTLWDVDQAKLDAATAEFGARSRAKRVDVTDPVAVERAAKEAEAAMGGVDVLVCSAGVAGVLLGRQDGRGRRRVEKIADGENDNARDDDPGRSQPSAARPRAPRSEGDEDEPDDENHGLRPREARRDRRCVRPAQVSVAADRVG